MADFSDEASRLRKLARDRNVIFSYGKHVLEEMTADDIARIDLENMFRKCRVTLVEDRKGETTWRPEGKDSDGRTLVAVVVAYEEKFEVKIITAWAKQVRRRVRRRK